MTEAKTNYVVTTNHKVTPERIAYVICAGIEGGIAYWASDFLLKTPGGYKKTGSDPWYVDPALYASDDWSIEVTDNEDGSKTSFGKKELLEALQIMAEKYPAHFRDIVEENEDAITGDVLIQLAAFKEIVYG